MSREALEQKQKAHAEKAVEYRRNADGWRGQIANLNQQIELALINAHREEGAAYGVGETLAELFPTEVTPFPVAPVPPGAESHAESAG